MYGRLSGCSSRVTHTWKKNRGMEVWVQLHLNTYLYSLLQKSRVIPHLIRLPFRGMSRSNTAEDVCDDVVSEESVKNAYDMIG